MILSVDGACFADLTNETDHTDGLHGRIPPGIEPFASISPKH